MFIARRQRIAKLIDEGFVVCNSVFKKNKSAVLARIADIYKESLFLSTHLSCEISLGAFVSGVCEHLRRLVIFY